MEPRSIHRRCTIKVIEVSGSTREIGCLTGEALREEIREHLSLFPPNIDKAVWAQRFPRFLETLKTCLPSVLTEMEGTAAGADIPLDTIFQLNLPMYANELVVDEGCTNIVFNDGPDGPLWGKNNDGLAKDSRRPVCARVVHRNDAIPTIGFTFCGMVATTDGMNAEGVAVGHSSVGSVFQQSDDFVPIRLWAYECLMQSRTTSEFVRRLSQIPTRGKGYSHVCVDADGAMCSVEAPCPIMQVRKPAPDARHMNCVNCYQLPTLADADRRTESGKCNAKARQRFLEQSLSELSDYSLVDMKAILCHHGHPSICRHGGTEDSFTEYSMIGLTQNRRVLFADGNPCQDTYQEIQL